MPAKGTVSVQVDTVGNPVADVRLFLRNISRVGELGIDAEDRTEGWPASVQDWLFMRTV
ncbi:MAG: hypothetical protein QNJ44_15820 [Rhodobacter sp.]|nr:hypothetical protein [Rhodobacter sp.]